MIRPTGRRILCRPLVTESRYPGSLIELTPDRVELETRQHAEVVAAGPGDHNEDGEWTPTDPRLRAGAWVLHSDMARVGIGEGDLFLLHEDDIVAILT